jgi:carbon starvation protein CstA
MLVDQTIRRFSEWWLLGTRSTAYWGHSLIDVANMYVGQAVGGGFLTLILFVVAISLAFQGIGIALASLEDNNSDYLLAWALGVALFTHCLLFIGVSYFGQVIVVWYLLLAVTGSLTPIDHPVHAFDISYNSHEKAIQN